MLPPRFFNTPVVGLGALLLRCGDTPRAAPGLQDASSFASNNFSRLAGQLKSPGPSPQRLPAEIHPGSAGKVSGCATSQLVWSTDVRRPAGRAATGDGRRSVHQRFEPLKWPDRPPRRWSQSAARPIHWLPGDQVANDPIGATESSFHLGGRAPGGRPVP